MTATQSRRIGWQVIVAFVGTTMAHGDRLFRRGGREKAPITAQFKVEKLLSSQATDMRLLLAVA